MGCPVSAPVCDTSVSSERTPCELKSVVNLTAGQRNICPETSLPSPLLPDQEIVLLEYPRGINAEQVTPAEDVRVPTDEVTNKEEETIAIVGIGVKTPGADNIRDFWRLLQNGENHIKEVPASRWNSDAFYSEDHTEPGKTYVTKAGFIKNAEQFDNAFFEINDYEAASLDPQQSFVLECTHMALEDAGLTRSQISGSKTGVFIGAMTPDHAGSFSMGSGEVDNYTATGVSNSLLSARVSYVYNLLGPSMVIDTACSSSLVCIHQGIQAIRNGDCEMAICGGVNYIGSPDMFIYLSKTKMLSPTGQSKAFSAEADGYTRGEGCGIVILKRVKDALKNNDPIWATIVSGVNQDGHTVTPVTAPSGIQQKALLRDMYTKFAVDVSKLDYIEAHGTGTQAGDPVEVNAIGNFLKEWGEPRERYLGSVKTNIGHLEAAAGVAGVIKVLLMMKHDTIVPSLHCQQVNPDIDLERLGLVVPQSLVKWESKDKVACCNSFGFGGTNSHVVLKQFRHTKCHISGKRCPKIVCFSGKTKQSVIRSMETVKEIESQGVSKLFKEEHTEEHVLGRIAYTSSVRRDHFTFRKALTVTKMQDLFDLVSQSVAKGLQLCPIRKPRLVFVFCGMGTAWPGMCRQLMHSFPVFREAIMRMDTILRELSSENPWSLVDRLSSEDSSVDPVLSPIAIFACQVALVALWRSLGVNPDCVVGQSVGEVAAAYTAGCLSLEAAVKIMYYRSKILAKVTGGKMMVVKNLSVETVRETLKDFYNASIALEYSPVSCAVSADSENIKKFEKKIKLYLYSGNNFETKSLNVQVAYHSPFVNSCKQQLARFLDNLEAISPKIVYISAVTGEKMTTPPDQGYWVNHLREPVLFHQALHAARRECSTDTVFLEIGPKPVLGSHMSDIFPNEDLPLIVSMARPQEENTFLKAAASLYEMGVDIRWEALNTCCHDIIAVPRYVFDKKISLKRTTIQALYSSGTEHVNHHLFLYPISTTEEYKIVLSPFTTPFVYDHMISQKVIVPGALYLEAGLAIAKQSREILTQQPVISATFISPVSAEKDKLIELDVRPDKDNQSQVSVSDQHRKVAEIHIDWCPVNRVTLINMQYIRNKCTARVLKKDIYLFLRDMGFEYGHTFTLLEDAYKCENECLALVRVVPEVSKDFLTTTIHPPVLDAMFQSVVIMNTPTESSGLQLLPESVNRLKVFGSMETDMYVHCCFLHDDGKHTSYRLTLLSTNGRVLATVDEFVVARLDVETRSSLPMLMSMEWKSACQMWDTNIPVAADAFILYTQPIPGRDDVTHVNHLRHCDDVRQWDEIYPEVSVLMQEAIHAPAIVVVCHTDFTPNMSCDELEAQVLKACGVIHSVLMFARDSNSNTPVYVCTLRAWPSVEKSCEQAEVNPADTAIWGMMRTAQDENIHPCVATVDIHFPATHLSPNFLTLMAQNLSTFAELQENSEYLITERTVYVNRVCRIDRHTSVPQFRKVAYEPEQDTLIVSDDVDAVVNPFAVRVLQSVNPSTCNAAIDPYILSLPSPFLTKATMMQEFGAVRSTKYNVVAIETVGQLVHEKGTEIAACYPATARSRMSVPAETTVPVSLIPEYRLGDLTKLVLLFQLSEKVPSGEVTILTLDTHVELACVLKMMLERKQPQNHHRVVTIETFQTLISVQSQTIVSLVLLDREVAAALAKQWQSAKYLVTCAALLTPEAFGCLSCAQPEVIVKSLDTELLFQPARLREVIPKVKEWLTKQDKENLLSLSPFLHASKQTHSGSCSQLGIERFSSMLTFKELIPSSIQVKADSHTLLSPSSVYIVVGGLTGLGWICVKFLARRGAKKIAIIQRRTPTEEHEANIEAISTQHCCIIRAFQADVTCLKSIKVALDQALDTFNPSALKGIFFGAAVVDDDSLPSMNRDKFDRALAPKLKGAWNFHVLTRDLPLDFFVMHSSAASVLGNQGQANYAAGNAFLDGLAYFRRNLGLPAQSFGWGGLATGLLDNKEKVQRKLESMGFILMTEDEIEESLLPLLMLNWPHCAPIKLDERRYVDRLQATKVQSLFNRFESLAASSDVKAAATLDSLADLQEVRSKDPAARMEAYCSFVKDLVSRVLMVDEAQVSLDTALVDLGLDSVSSMMFIDLIARFTPTRLKAGTILSGEVTIRSIAQTLSDAAGSSP